MDFDVKNLHWIREPENYSITKDKKDLYKK